MKDKQGDKQRLLHILLSIEEVEKYIEGQSFDDFQRNSMMRFASVKQMEIIGEAANNISVDLKGRFPEIQWRQITALRHVLVHEYFGVDHELIWQIIKTDIPVLKAGVSVIVSSLEEQ